MLKNVAEFYRNYPNLRKEDDGKYHIHDVNANEPLWGGQDTDEEIASMMAIFPTAIRAAEILNVDADLRSKWREVADNLAPLPRSDNPAAGTAIRPVADNGGRPTWVKAINSCQERQRRLPVPTATRCRFGFSICALWKQPARCVKPATPRRPDYVPSQLGPRRGAGVLSKVPLLAATMGRADAVKAMVPAQMQGGTQGVLLANRMDLKEGVQTQCNERMGNASDALTMALCQSVPAGPAQPSVIRVFPAWPETWDADFKLLCRGNFLVSSAMHDGRIEFVEVHSQSGGRCRIAQSVGWRMPRCIATVRCRRKSKARFLSFDTAKGDDIVLVRAGTKPEQFKREIRPAAQ